MPKLCEKCGKPNLHQSRPKNLVEALSAWMLIRPYRCTHCNIRTFKFAWWWERKVKSRRPHSGRSNDDVSIGESVPLEEVRSAIKQREEKKKDPFTESIHDGS